MTVEDLTRLRKVNMETVDRQALARMEEVVVDTALPAARRVLAYLEQVKNPYCFLCGNTPVKVCFAPDGKDLGETVKSYFMGRKR